MTIVGHGTATFARPTGGIAAAIYPDGTVGLLFTRDAVEADRVLAGAKTAAATAAGAQLSVARDGLVVYVSDEKIAGRAKHQVEACLP